jgi:hypothetical protein
MEEEHTGLWGKFEAQQSKALMRRKGKGAGSAIHAFQRTPFLTFHQAF